ncbi:MAG: M48 family metallopeptidase [Candidatus Pacebacteria bacterium]|jgi:predicted metal-dependent hydrolase|nr:M48 family metallopeptidase [Candidatus Paceibacterota bacterium]
MVYTLKFSKRSRSLRLTVNCEGNVIVSAPEHTDLSLIENFITKKKSWILDKIQYFSSFTTKIKTTKRDYLLYKEKARALAQNKIEHYNKVYNFAYKNISIRNQKTRWGSCSRTGSINFNYKIALIPEHLAEYIIVHELCHIGELNHSQDFWDLVAITMPEYKKHRAELRKIHI